MGAALIFAIIFVRCFHKMTEFETDWLLQRMLSPTSHLKWHVGHLWGGFDPNLLEWLVWTAEIPVECVLDGWQNAWPKQDQRLFLPHVLAFFLSPLIKSTSGLCVYRWNPIRLCGKWERGSLCLSMRVAVENHARTHTHTDSVRDSLRQHLTVVPKWKTKQGKESQGVI